MLEIQLQKDVCHFLLGCSLLNWGVVFAIVLTTYWQLWSFIQLCDDLKQGGKKIDEISFAWNAYSTGFLVAVVMYGEEISWPLVSFNGVLLVVAHGKVIYTVYKLQEKKVFLSQAFWLGVMVSVPTSFEATLIWWPESMEVVFFAVMFVAPLSMFLQIYRLSAAGHRGKLKRNLVLSTVFGGVAWALYVYVVEEEPHWGIEAITTLDLVACITLWLVWECLPSGVAVVNDRQANNG